jgi:hypothetical protein
MQTFINIIIFCIIVFLYIHVNYQFKKGEDLEIYELDYTSNTHLQEICNVKQPVLFQFKFDELENMTPEKLSKTVGSHECKVKDTYDYYDEKVVSVDHVNFPFQTAYKIFMRDPKGRYYTENNEFFLEESGIIGELQEIDAFLKPNFCMKTKYDFLCGSSDTGMPLRYHNYDRYFLIVVSGKIRVKMTHYKSRKYLHTIKDYEKYEFRSPVDAWKVQQNYEKDMEKIRFLEFDVPTNHVLYVPPYWYYSIQFTEKTSVFAATYCTIMNAVAHSPEWGRYYLQQANIQKKIAKTMDIPSEEEVKITDSQEPSHLYDSNTTAL